ncbi:hypothetical protein B5M09_005898 [Aphanomyces astaci]|uniref:Ribosomal protein eL8/eL30/eS12/Gadd45 domain-containing protein n=1 Tax=Aphanomyces astaci TaxID=112090 RepID=A0A3R7YII7_APHAT|nr:hypothetical protein B5M09_005898 [Aphanomyces astaci]
MMRLSIVGVERVRNLEELAQRQGYVLLHNHLSICLQPRDLYNVVVAKLVILSSNTPPLRKSEIEYYSMLAKTGVHHFAGNNNDLGTACGKYFRVSSLVVLDAGDSDILRSSE